MITYFYYICMAVIIVAIPLMFRQMWIDARQSLRDKKARELLIETKKAALKRRGEILDLFTIDIQEWQKENKKYEIFPLGHPNFQNEEYIEHIKKGVTLAEKINKFHREEK